ncbi:MAG: hypothetical protein V7739_20075 [Motiliproteus sp.]
MTKSNALESTGGFAMNKTCQAVLFQTATGFYESLKTLGESTPLEVINAVRLAKSDMPEYLWVSLCDSLSFEANCKGESVLAERIQELMRCVLAGTSISAEMGIEVQDTLCGDHSDMREVPCCNKTSVHMKVSSRHRFSSDFSVK